MNQRIEYIERIIYMNITEEITYLRMEKDKDPEHIKPKLAMLEAIHKNGEDFLYKNQEILHIVYNLLLKDISHMFIAKQLFAFYTPKEMMRYGKITMKFIRTQSLNTASGQEIAKFIRSKTNFIANKSLLHKDPRINPISIIKSCLEIEKYLCGAKLIF